MRQGRPDQSPRSETCRLQRCPRTGIQPFPPRPPRLWPHSPGFILLPARHPPAGALRQPLWPRPSTAGSTAAACPDAEANPLFLFGFPTPPRGGARDSHGGIRRCRSSLGKESRPSVCLQSALRLPPTRYALRNSITPLGSRAQDGIWAPTLFVY